MSESQPDTGGLLRNSSSDYGTGKGQNQTPATLSKQSPKKDTCFGKYRSCNDLGAIEIIFLTLYVCLLPLTLVNDIMRLASLSPKSPDFAFAVLLMVNAVFSGAFAVHGILKYRALEILVASVSSSLVLVYIIADFRFSKHTAMKIGRLIFAVCVGPACIISGFCLIWMYEVQYQTRRFIFRVVGSAWKGPQDQRARWYTLCDLLFFYLQLSCNIATLGITSRHNVDTQEIAGLCVWFFLSLLCLSLGLYAIKKQSTNCLKLYCACSVLFGSAYTVYRFVRVGETDENRKYRDLQISTYVCGGLIFVVLLYITVLTYRTARYNGGTTDTDKLTGAADTTEIAE